jgi:hypothetical protein
MVTVTTRGDQSTSDFLTLAGMRDAAAGFTALPSLGAVPLEEPHEAAADPASNGDWCACGRPVDDVIHGCPPRAEKRRRRLGLRWLIWFWWQGVNR